MLNIGVHNNKNNADIAVADAVKVEKSKSKCKRTIKNLRYVI